MNELDLLQAGLGNGTYYVVAENTDGRKSANSNEVEVSDIMPSIEITHLHILENGDLEVYFHTKDINTGTNIKAIIGAFADKEDVRTLLEAATVSLPTVAVTSGVTSYKLTMTTLEYKVNLPADINGDYEFRLYVFTEDLVYLSDLNGSTIGNAIDNKEFLAKIYKNITHQYDKTANSMEFGIETDVYSNFDDTSVTVFCKTSTSVPETLIPGELNPINVQNTFFVYSLPTYTGGKLTFATGSTPNAETKGFAVFGCHLTTLHCTNKFAFYYTIIEDAVIDNDRDGYFIEIGDKVPYDWKLDAPILTYATSDRKLQWDDVEGALSYSVYKDGKKVGTVQDGHFTPDPSAAVLAASKQARIAVPETRAVYDLDKNVVGYVTPEGKFKKSLE